MKLHPWYRKSYHPYNDWKIPEEFFMKLPSDYSFDLQEMRTYIDSVVDKVGLLPLQVLATQSIYSPGYVGMGFTHRKEAPDPDHDAFRLYNEKGEYDSSSRLRRTMNSLLKEQHIHHFEKNFTEKTPYYAGPLEKVLNKFQSLITKVRIMQLGPGEMVKEHFDYPYYENVRLHTVLETNDQVEWWVEDNCFKIPSDGNWYWFDTGRMHKVFNNGNTIRRILCVHLSVYKDKDGNLIHGPETSLLELMKQSKL